jgi:hypothetical protein
MGGWKTFEARQILTEVKKPAMEVKMRGGKTGREPWRQDRQDITLIVL